MYDFRDNYGVCGNCHKVFKYEELLDKKRILFGNTTITEKVCPGCGFPSYTMDSVLEYFKQKGEY